MGSRIGRGNQLSCHLTQRSVRRNDVGCCLTIRRVDVLISVVLVVVIPPREEPPEGTKPSSSTTILTTLEKPWQDAILHFWKGDERKGVCIRDDDNRGKKETEETAK